MVKMVLQYQTLNANCSLFAGNEGQMGLQGPIGKTGERGKQIYLYLTTLPLTEFKSRIADGHDLHGTSVINQTVRHKFKYT